MVNVIVFGQDQTNTVGIIQSLGLAGYKSLALLYGPKTGFVKSSRFCRGIISASDEQACIEKLLS